MVRRIALSLSLIALSPMLGGCVVWDIKNNLVSINDRLGSVDGRLTEIDGELKLINENLDTLEADLDPLLELEKLAQLEKINESIDPIEKHLASLRKTIANIDSTVPFLNISSDTGEEEELQADPEDEDAAEETPDGGE